MYILPIKKLIDFLNLPMTVLECSIESSRIIN